MSEATPRYGNVYFPFFPVHGTYTPPPRYAVDNHAESPPDPRSVVRWILLSLAYDILKTRHPNRSPNNLYLDLAEYYGCSWDTVRMAREFVRERWAKRRTSGQQIDLAMFAMPTICFGGFTSAGL